MQHRLFAAAAFAIAAALPSTALAQRTWNRVTTGNGHGFAVFDASPGAYKITTFLEHPYRYLAPTPGNPTGEGISRRNLAYDFYFGIKGSDWLNHAVDASPEYVDQSNVIHAPGPSGTDSYFFMPFGLERNVLVALLKAPGASDAAALFNFHMGSRNGTEGGTDNEQTRAGASPGVAIETGPGGGAMVYVGLTPIDAADCNGPFAKIASGLQNSPACGPGNDIALGMQGKVQNGWFAVAAGYTDDPTAADALATDIKTWANNRTPDVILSDALKEFESWRKPPPDGTSLCSDDEKKLWRQSETTLRMGQVREPNIAGRNNHGMILASLPIGEWHTGWVRDAQYAIVALARMGHWDEAKAALDFLLTNATPTGKYKSKLKVPADYKISVVRYFGTGEEEADYDQNGYPNIEIDGWGMVMWSARQYAQAANDTAWLASVYPTLSGLVASPLEQNLEPNGIVVADSSIWEVHQENNRHYAFTTMAAARGFCDMAAIAKMAGKSGDIAKYQALSKKVKDGFLGTFVDPQGALAGSLEGLSSGHYQDGSLAEAFDWNILPDFKGDTAKATLDLLGKLRVASGGYKRNDDGLSSYDNNEWILVDMRIANALRRSGNGAAADAIMATLVTKAKDNFYILPELFNDTASDGQIGVYTGSIPMVGYGGGAYVITMLDRSGIAEPNDCGDAMGVTLPKVDCSTISTQPGNTGPGANGGDGDGGAGGVPDASQIPFVDACLCNLVRGLDGERGIPPFGIVTVLLGPIALWLRRRSKRA